MEGPESYYVRGAGSVALPTRRVLAVVFTAITTTLAVVALAVTVVDLRQLHDRRALARDGFPVDVTISGCVAIASGTGITESGFTCRGRYLVAGDTYDEVIRGSSQQFSVGAHTRALTSVTSPSELYSIHSIRADLSYRSALVVPAVVAGLSISALTCTLALLYGRPVRRRYATGKSHVGATQTSASWH